MPKFHYKGRNNKGIAIEGVSDASSKEALAELLMQKAITPISIELSKTQLELGALLKNLATFTRVPIEELMLFSRQMYTLQRAGIPIVTAVKRMAENNKNKHLVEALNDIAERLSAGQDLAQAMAQHPNIFSKLFVNIVRVGEQSGRLDSSFLQMSRHLELEEKTLKQLKTALRYPAFVVIALLTALLVINAFVIPTFAKLFSSLQGQLPLATRMIIGTSNFITQQWYVVLALVILVTISLRYYLLTPNGRFAWHKKQMHLPVIGPILSKIIYSRFASNFALALKSGIPIIDGLKLVHQTLDNAYASQKIRTIRQEISRGESLTQASKMSEFFSPLMLQMIAVGEDTGNLEQLMEEMSMFYDREIDFEVQRIGDSIEPIMLVGLGIMVLILALGVLLPMWNLVKLTKGG